MWRTNRFRCTSCALGGRASSMRAIEILILIGALQPNAAAPIAVRSRPQDQTIAFVELVQEQQEFALRGHSVGEQPRWGIFEKFQEFHKGPSYAS